MGPVGQLVQGRDMGAMDENEKMTIVREPLTSKALGGMVEKASGKLNIIINGPVYSDLLLPYVLLRRIYQQLTNLMLSLGKPLLDVRVFLRPQFCQSLPDVETSLPDTFEFESLSMEEGEERDRSPACISSLPNLPLRRYKRVGIGGTFDHLHAGHKLMLSVAAMLTRETLLCGVTAPGGRMLEGKHYKERIEGWEDRVQRVKEFLGEFCPKNVQVEIIQLNDPFGPTISDLTLEALIVSPETYTGGEAINRIRVQNGMTPLELITIDLIGINRSVIAAKSAVGPTTSGTSELAEEAKLSSTLLRSFIAKE